MPRKRKFQWDPDGRRRTIGVHPVIEGWLIADLQPLTNLTRRMINHYVHQELVPKPPYHGNRTRYGRTQLLYLLAVDTVKRQEKLGIEALKQRLKETSEADLEAYLKPLIKAPNTRAAMGWDPLPQAPPLADTALGQAGGALLPFQNWSHISILPGLELKLRSDASPLVVELAREFYAHCVGASRKTGS